MPARKEVTENPPPAVAKSAVAGDGDEAMSMTNTADADASQSHSAAALKQNVNVVSHVEAPPPHPHPASPPCAAFLMGSPETRILRSGKKQKRRRSRDRDDDDEADAGGDKDAKDENTKRSKLTTLTTDVHLSETVAVNDDKQEKEDADMKEAAAPMVAEVEAAAAPTVDADMKEAAAPTAAVAATANAAAIAPEAATYHFQPRPAAGTVPAAAPAVLKPMVLELPRRQQQQKEEGDVAVAVPGVPTASTSTVVSSTTQTRKAVTKLKHLTGETEVVVEEQSQTTELPAVQVQTPHRDQLFQKMAGLYATPAREGVLSTLQPQPVPSSLQQQEQQQDVAAASASAPAALNPNVVSLPQEKQQTTTTTVTVEEEIIQEVTLEEEEVMVAATTPSFLSKHKTIVVVVASLLAVVAAMGTYYMAIPAQPAVGGDIMKDKLDVDATWNTLPPPLDVDEVEVPEVKTDTSTEAEAGGKVADDDKIAKEEYLKDGEHEVPKDIIYHDSEEKTLLDDDLNKNLEEEEMPVAGAGNNIEEEEHEHASDNKADEPESSDPVAETEADLEPEPVVENEMIEEPTEPESSEPVAEAEAEPELEPVEEKETSKEPTDKADEHASEPESSEPVAETEAELDLEPVEEEMVKEPTEPESFEPVAETEAELPVEPVEEEMVKEPTEPEADEPPQEEMETEKKDEDEPVKATLTDEEAKVEAGKRLQEQARQDQYQTDMDSYEAVQMIMNRVRKADAEGKQKNGTFEDIERVANDIAAEEAELQVVEQAMKEAEEALQSLLSLSSAEVEQQDPALVKLANDKIDALNELSPSVEIPKVLDASQVKLPKNTPDCELQEEIELPAPVVVVVSEEDQKDASQYVKQSDVDVASQTLHEWADELVVTKTQGRQSEDTLTSIKHWLQTEYELVSDRLLGSVLVDTEKAAESSSLGVKPVEYSAPSSASTSDSVNGEDQGQEDDGVTREQVEISMSEKLRVYAADGTGQLDYAAVLHGASVVRGKTSASFADTLPPVSRMLHYLGLRFYGHPPEQALSRVDPPGTLGQCWAFRESRATEDGSSSSSSLLGVEEGDYATLSVKLSKPVRVTSVSLEHPLPTTGSTDDDMSKAHSAVKSFRVYGYQDPDLEQEPFMLGEFTYDIKSTKSLQEFAVTTTRGEGGTRSMPPFAAVTLAIDSNWGHDYACLYRFRVHSSSS
jgi:hypothetical protein